MFFVKVKLIYEFTKLNIVVFHILLRIFLCVCFARRYVLRCAIWYHLYNLKNEENTPGRVLPLVLPLLKVTLFMGAFHVF